MKYVHTDKNTKGVRDARQIQTALLISEIAASVKGNVRKLLKMLELNLELPLQVIWVFVNQIAQFNSLIECTGE